MVEIISLPMETVQENTFMLYHPRMLKEIEDWCDEQLAGHYVVRYFTMMARKCVGLPFEVHFSEDNDAILFKMRWL
jgi:hypothetical protein